MSWTGAARQRTRRKAAARETVVRAPTGSSAEDPTEALVTVGFAAAFLRVRCLASPVQLINYHSSFSLQAVGNGRYTMLHACVRELGIYIPLMFLLDALFGQMGLASALPVSEGLAAVFALWLLHRALRPRTEPRAAEE